MSLSLILCTVGRCEEIAAFFDSLLRQRRDDVDVILVDQNADDRLVPIVERYTGHFPLRHVRTQTRGLSRARNIGLKYATGDLIGFPDDDCEYFDHFLPRVAAMFERDSSLGGLTGYPTADRDSTLANWNDDAMTLDRLAVLNRCQEFTIFLRREAIGEIRFNDALGVGAGTPWGADEGPDFLIRVIERGAKLVFYPKLFVYHPDKVQTITPAQLQRAASYARGRGCFFRLHRFPIATVARGVVRPAVGAMLYLALLKPMRSRYYAAVVRGMLRGLTMSAAELREVRQQLIPPGADGLTLGGAHVHG
ncbi:MAG: glycosyl transferase [Phycisphaerales bacterium]|nr:glycosyl transferase [Phycisphaerales bacterium]